MDLTAYRRRDAGQDSRIAAPGCFGTVAACFASRYLAIGYLHLRHPMRPAGAVHAFCAARLCLLQRDCGHRSQCGACRRTDWAGHGLSPRAVGSFEGKTRNRDPHRPGEIHSTALREWTATGPGRGPARPPAELR